MVRLVRRGGGIRRTARIRGEKDSEVLNGGEVGAGWSAGKEARACRGVVEGGCEGLGCLWGRG